jgi:hypothetical protein
MTDANRDLDDAIQALVNVAIRRGAWAVECQHSPTRAREAARLSVELATAKNALRRLFLERVVLREVGLDGTPILERVP